MLQNELNPIVQRDTFSRSYDAFKDGARWESGSARVAINEWLAQYSIKMKQIEVRSGIETKIKIIPKLRAASIDIKQLDPWDRECFFQDEVEACKSKGCEEFKYVLSQFNHFSQEMSIFKYYREEGCLFECRLRFAAQEAGCIPWDYPLLKNMSELPLCKSRTLEKFETSMDRNDSLTYCKCLPNCEEVEYETQVRVGEILLHL